MAYKVTQSNPASNTPANLYTVPSAKNAIISTLTICNFGAAANYTIRIRPGGATAADVHLLAKTVSIDTNDTVFLTVGVALSATDVITVEASTSSVTFMAFINEVDE
jgi:hypothetical protein